MSDLRELANQVDPSINSNALPYLPIQRADQLAHYMLIKILGFLLCFNMDWTRLFHLLSLEVIFLVSRLYTEHFKRHLLLEYQNAQS